MVGLDGNGKRPEGVKRRARHMSDTISTGVQVQSGINCGQGER